MNATVKEHLAFLYGESAAGGLVETVKILMRKRAKPVIPAALSGKSDLTEADCMLITYGDQVRAANKRPSKRSRSFLHSRDGRDQRGHTFFHSTRAHPTMDFQ